jgi:Tol biopolymer transport system component
VPVRLTDHPGSAAAPVFSPDGSWIAYSRVVGAARNIWTVSRSGGPPTPFTERAGVDVQPGFSPDGSRLAFISDRRGGEHVWVARIAPGWHEAEARQVTTGAAFDLWPAWSPDGTSLAFVRDSEVWTVGADGDLPPRCLTRGARAEIVRWDPSGAAVLVAGSWGRGSCELRRVLIRDGSEASFDPPVVFGDAHSWSSFAASADGRVLAYSMSETRGDLWMATVGTGR